MIVPLVTSPLDAYFNALDAGDTAGAAAAFAADAVYIRPARTAAGGPPTLDIIRGRDGIHEFFERRGTMPHRHEVSSSVVDGCDCFVEALMVTETGTSGIFIAHATFDGDGLVTRYLAVMAEPPADDEPTAGAAG